MATPDRRPGPTPLQGGVKRALDLAVAITGLLATSWIVLPAWVLASLDTGANGFFRQERVGRGGRIFRVVKLRTMRPDTGVTTTVSTTNDPRITPLGRFFRRAKIDEIPQLWNVLRGEMSLVGPRPDVPGFADRLEGGDRVILEVRPGITGPATLKYRDEERQLASQADPERYNRDVIFPDKVRLNREYVERFSLREDLRCLWRTLIP